MTVAEGLLWTGAVCLVAAMVTNGVLDRRAGRVAGALAIAGALLMVAAIWTEVLA